MALPDSSEDVTDIELAEAPSKQLVAFEPNDPENPYNWSPWRKYYIEFIGTLIILNSTIDSTEPSSSKPQLEARFNVHQDDQLVLPNSVFLIGYVLGPLLFAPLSETIGRRKVLTITFTLFTIFTLVICFSPNWAAFIIFRLLTGIFASPAVSIIGGLYADIYGDPVRRGRAIASFMTIASFGPAFGPACAGYLSRLSWRWPFWFAFILAGFSLTLVLLLPETFGPALLRQRAQRIRKRDPDANVWAPTELVTMSKSQMAKKYLGRPLRMLFTEPIVTFSCLFLSLIYAILFILFQGYEFIFAPIYGFNQGEVGLAFLPVCIGTLIAWPIYLWWEVTLTQAQKREAAWTKKEEYKRLPLALIGGPFFTAGLFWIGWAARKDVHWIVPMLGGMPLGIGFVLIFVSLINYMADAYGIFAASALGAASIARSTCGVVLPFATSAMFRRLGVAWACTLLGILSLIMCFIPLVFIRFGPVIRAKSKMCEELIRMHMAPAPAAPSTSDSRPSHATHATADGWDVHVSEKKQEEEDEVEGYVTEFSGAGGAGESCGFDAAERDAAAAAGK